MAATTEPPPLDDTNLLDDEPGPTPTITPTSPSPPSPADENLILSDDPVTEDLESPFEDPSDLMKPVALDDGPDFEPVSLGSEEPSVALPGNRGITSPSLISAQLVNGDHEAAPFATPPPSNGSGALFDDDDDDDDLFPSTKITNNQAPVLSLDQTDSTAGTPSPSHVAAPVIAPSSPKLEPAFTPMPEPAFTPMPAAAAPASFAPVASAPTPVLITAPVETPASKGSGEGEDEFFLEIRVHDPAKVGDGMGAYVSYKVTTKTNLPAFRKSNYNVSRRFSDFLGLHRKLVSKHMVAGRIVPPAPEKNAFGAMGVKMTKEYQTSQEFIERRRAALERFLNRTAAHPVLRMDPDFRDFLEIDELPRATETSALSVASIGKVFASLEDKVNKIAYRVDEADAWFEEKGMMIENLDTQLRKLHASLESLVFQRRDLVTNTAQFAKSCALLSNAEEHTGLSRALSHLAEVEEKVEQVHAEQSSADFFTFSETIRDYVALLGAVKDVFNQRVKIYTNWRNTVALLPKRRELATKYQQQGKIDKQRLTEDEIVKLEGRMEAEQKEFEACSKTIRSEMEKFEATRIQDFKATIISYLEILMDSQQKLVTHWEAFLPEAKAIA